MAGLLKNQILKHLSKFTKNLSADKINLSTFKGEGELSNLELNEDILTQVLELPTWLRITKAICNRVSVKIQWTKLKSQPICLYLDEVIVETETCEQPRAPNSQNQQAAGGKYGFVDRVMDGIYVHVNSVVVKLASHKFQASLQLSRVRVQSMTPNWQVPTELRSTRIRDADRGEVLLFKEIEWQTTRIEATAVSSDEDFLTPLRLIANQAKIRIVVKKTLSDCAIISSRLILLLDDLLWVLTITQLKAAILYANSLKELIERSAQQSKKLAAEKLKKQGHMSESSQGHLQTNPKAAPDRQESTTAKYFCKFDVVSTSYHLITSRFDLHLCDDSSPAEEEESKRHWKINGGSMQMTFYKLSIDFYPFHPAGGERKSWYRYLDNVGSRNPWVNKLFTEFREEAVKLRKVCEASPIPSSSSAPSLLAQQSAASARNTLAPGTSQSVNTSPVHNFKTTAGSRSAQASPVHQGQVAAKSTRLLESCFVVKIEDVTIYMVSMPGRKRTGPNKLLCSDKKQLHLPPDMSVLHVEFTDYFFPEGLDYPVPHSNLYVLVNPVRVTLDFLTLLWSNVFLLTLSHSLDMDFGEKEAPEHVDVKLEVLLPRLIFPAEEKVEGQPDRPDAVQLQMSKLVVTNRRTEEKMSREDLAAVIEQYKKAPLFSSTEISRDENSSNEIIPRLLRDHAVHKDNPFLDQNVKLLLDQHLDNSPVGQAGADRRQQQHSPSYKLSCNSLKRLASSDIWSASAEQVWLEFLGILNNKNRPAPFVEAVPVTVWLSSTLSQPSPSRIGPTKANEANEDVGELLKLHKNSTSNADSQVYSIPSTARHNSSLPNNNDRNGGSELSMGKQLTTDGTDSRFPLRDYNGDGNSFPSSHHHNQNYSYGHQTVRPQGSDNSNEGFQRLKSHVNSELNSEVTGQVLYSSNVSSPKQTQSKGGGPQHELRGGEYSDARRGRRKSLTSESRNLTDAHAQKSLTSEARNFIDVHAQKSGGHFDYQEVQQRQDRQQRQERQFQREDSRSSSSPPMLQAEPSSRRREEPTDRRSQERRRRHGSSSSRDRREMDIEGSSGRGYGQRLMAEERMASDSNRGNSLRLPVKELKKRNGEGENVHRREDEIPNNYHGYRRSRHGSSSGSEIGANTAVQGERPRHRSDSRESKKVVSERYTEETEQYQKGGSYRSHGERSARVEAKHSLEYTQGLRPARDGSRECSGERRERAQDQSLDRSSLKSTRRDQVDGIASTYHSRSHEQSGEGRGLGDSRKSVDSRRRQRSLSRGGESPRGRSHDRTGSARSQYHTDESDYTSKCEPHSKSRHSDGDCDNDRFSHTSHSSLETPKSPPEQNLVDHPATRPMAEDSPLWPEDGTAESWTKANKQLPVPEAKLQGQNVSTNHLPHSSAEPDKRICVLTKLGGKLRIQLNHFQYLFLLRLSESLSAFQNDLAADLLSVSSAVSRKPVKPQARLVVSVPLVLKELELAIVCPYQMHQRTFSDDISVISPFLQGLPTGHDAVFGDDGDGTCFPQLVDNIRGHRPKDDGSLKPFQSGSAFKSSSSSQLEKLSSEISHQYVKGYLAGSSTAINQITTGHSGPALFATDNRKDFDAMSQSLNSIGKDSGIGIDRKPPTHKQPSRPAGSSKAAPGHKGTSDIKKAFTSAFFSMTDKLKTKMESLDDTFGTDDDTVSIPTDTSDDDFEHLSLDEAEEVPAFFHDPPPPDITSAGDNFSEFGDPGDSVSVYAESSTTKGKEMVYVVLFKLDHTEIWMENAGETTTAAAQLGKLASLSLGNISYDDFHNRFQTDKGYLQEEVSDTPPPRYPVRLKMDVPEPDPSKTVSPDGGRLVVLASDLSLQFKMTGVTCLSDFVEDEKMPEFLPLSLDVQNLLLVLEEDRPSSNITSPGAVPTNLHIQHLSIERGKDGVVYISGRPTSNVPDHLATTSSAPHHKPEYVNAVTSPIMSPDGTMALLMASQNESVLLRRQLEEVRRANRLYESQILQWREMQDQALGQRSATGAGASSGRSGLMHKRPSFTTNSLSSSPSSTGLPETGTSPSRFQRADIDQTREELESENLKLQQKMVRLEDDLLILSKEKESLLQTLQLLQDELLASERKHRTRPT